MAASDAYNVRPGTGVTNNYYGAGVPGGGAGGETDWGAVIGQLLT